MMLQLSGTGYGSGPLLACHPGGPGMDPRYMAQLAALASDRHVVLLHPRGTGDSPRPDDPLDYAVQQYADDLAAWLQAEAAGPADLLGHSHGGVVVARVAAQHPELVRKVVLMATPAYGGESAVKEAEEFQHERVGEPECALAMKALEEQGYEYPPEAELGRLIARVIPLWVGPMSERLRLWQAEVAAQPANVDALRYFNEKVFPVLNGVLDDVARIVCPVLAVSGELDGWAGANHLALLQQAARAARSAVIPNSGHMCHADASEAICATVAEFLAEGVT